MTSVGLLRERPNHRLKVLQVAREERYSQPLSGRGNQAIHHVDVMAEPELQGLPDRPVEIFWQNFDPFKTVKELNSSSLRL
jgi:hypothetical protein